jgi:hypothetical protein
VCSFRVAAGTRGASATVALTHTLTNVDSNPFGRTLLQMLIVATRERDALGARIESLRRELSAEPVFLRAC